MQNFYREKIEKVAMEKIAMRAWKKNFSKLNSFSKQKLVDSGILNYDKELKGLRRGTHELNRKNSVKRTRKPGMIGGFLQEETNKLSKMFGTPNYKEVSKEFNPPPTPREAAPKSGFRFKSNPDRKSNSQLSNNSNLRFNVKKGKDIITDNGPVNLVSRANSPHASLKGKHNAQYVPKGAYNKLVENPNFSTILSKEDKIPRRDREGKKWTQAILERHEADEARYGNKIKDKDRYTLAGNPDVKTRYSGHINPKVLARESANIAIAPPDAQKYMRKIRNKTSETIDFANRYGEPYGTNPVYNKKLGNKMENSVRKDINAGLKQYKDLGYDVKQGW